MADTKITALLTPQVTTNPATDVLPIVNIADTLMASSGSTRKITVNSLLGAGGTATLASATITGDLTARNWFVTGGSLPGVGNSNPFAYRIGGGGLGIGAATETGTTAPIVFYCGAGGVEQYRIAPLGVNTWSDGAGSTRMTLNATGLGVGASPAERLTIGSTTAANYIKLTNSGAATGLLIGCFNTAVDIKNREVGAINLFTSDTQRMVISATGDVTISTGNVVMATSGKGIDFSATANSSGTMTSELLNDYEEGTFVPTISSGATAVTFSTNAGTYTKIGRLVTVFIRLVTTAATRNGSQFTISGLPFSAVTDGSGVIAYNSSGFISTAGGNKPNLLIGGADINFFTSSGGNFVGTAIAADVFEVRLTATYYV